MALLPVGRPKVFNSPDEIAQVFNEYCKWIEDNPFEITKTETTTVGDKEFSKLKTETRIRPMTIQGFRLFAGIASSTFYNYENDPQFLEIIAHVKAAIYEQKFAGAAAELLNPNIIARDLGLADQRKTDHTSSDGSMSPPAVDLSQLTQEQLEQLRNIATACKPGSDQR